MELKEQISGLAIVISGLNRSIAELEEAISASAAPLPDIEERLSTLIRELEEKMHSMNLLKMRYDQRMLSGMVKEGIGNDETMGWWINRY